jgi:iron complex outermembrane recepter protein
MSCGRRIVQRQAIFAQVDQKFFQHWTVTAGLRYTKDKARYEDGLLYDGTPTSSTSVRPMPVTYTIGSAAGPLPTQYGSNGAVTGRAALTYEFDTGAIVYGSYNRGYRSGAFPGQAASPAAITYVKPETVNAFELGAKDTLFGNRVSVSSALFLSNYDNQQLNEIIGVIQYLSNAGKAQIYGFEFQGDALLARGVKANLSFSLLHTEYKELVLSGQNLAGNRLPFAPAATVSAGIDWDVARFAGGQLTFSPRVNFQGLTYFTAENSLGPISDSNMQQDAYAKVNASLGWVRDNLTLRLFVNNAFDKGTFVWGTDLREAFGIDHLIRDSPRTFGGSVRYDF